MKQKIENRQDKKPVPTSRELERELNRVRLRMRYFATLRSTIFGLITVASVAVIVAIVFLPMLQIYGKSMTPTLYEGNIVISIKGAEFERGDIISFYHENSILIKRVIAFEGEWVDIDREGNVYVNGKELEEPYISNKAYGEVTVRFPYQVPDGQIFVMGDHRATSQDSRTRTIGCIASDRIVGKIVFRIWPVYEFGAIQ